MTMRDGTEMDYQELLSEAAGAVEASGKSQSEIGREIGVTSGAMSRALSEPGPKFQELQRRIIQHLTPYQVERQVTFKARRKG